MLSSCKAELIEKLSKYCFYVFFDFLARSFFEEQRYQPACDFVKNELENLHSLI